jgi:tetratricopeptide (TPR) repeat protein
MTHLTEVMPHILAGTCDRCGEGVMCADEGYKKRKFAGLSPETLMNEAVRDWERGQFDEGLWKHQLAIDRFRARRDYDLAGSWGFEIGQNFFYAKGFAKALMFLRMAIDDFELAADALAGEPEDSDGDSVGLAVSTAECRYLCGACLSHMSMHPSLAMVYLREAGHAFAEHHEWKRTGDAQLMWGSVLRTLGIDKQNERLLRVALARFDAAKKLYERAEDEEIGSAGVGPAQCFLSSGAACLELGEYDRLIEQYPAAKALFVERGDEQQRKWCDDLHATAVKAKRSLGAGNA